MDNAHKTALVTGANSGLGFEAAAQLAADGWGRVILACRTLEKAEAAREQLVARTGRDPFAMVAVDTSEVASAEAAAARLAELGGTIDFLLLNAGASSKEPRFNSDGVETTYASTLIGHHVLTLRALEQGLLAPQARIVIAGSEGARGNMPGMRVHDVAGIAADHFEGYRAAAIEALAKMQAPGQDGFANIDEYVTAKVVVAWWAAALARRLPEGMTVNAVSPGANADTSFARDAPVAMRLVMVPAMKLFGPLLGTNGPVDQGARRYLDAARYGDDQSGAFYATAHRRRAVGPVAAQTWPAYFVDEDAQEAGFEALVRLTGVGTA
jgi:NAD(P)-dependent dehydrogenase (short-subunit alcohol dehydrogenase family)